MAFLCEGIDMSVRVQYFMASLRDALYRATDTPVITNQIVHVDEVYQFYWCLTQSSGSGGS